MAIVVIRPEDNVLTITVRDRLAEEDYRRFVKEIAWLSESREKIRMLFEVVGPCGWTDGALWDEVAFDPACFERVERVAVVGDRECEKAMDVFCRPFCKAEVRYFEADKRGKARHWLEISDPPSKQAAQD